MRRLAWVALAGVALTVTGCTLNRPADPVVMTGAQLPALQTRRCGRRGRLPLVNGWDQVPVQVDERKQVDLGRRLQQHADGLHDDGLRGPRHVHGGRLERQRRRRRRGRVHGQGRRAPGAVQRGHARGSGGRQRREGQGAQLAGRRRRRLGLPVQAQRQPQPRRRPELRQLRLQPAVGRVQDDLQAPGRPQPGGLDGHDAVLHRPLLRPLAQGRPAGQDRRRLRGRTSSTAPRRR